MGNQEKKDIPKKNNKFHTSRTKTLPLYLIGLQKGTIFAGRYEVIEELGQGGMGKVYRVLDKKIDEEVALKLIRPEVAIDEMMIERFRNELKFARKITHKNVCRMFDINEEEDINYITMEYVSGEDLRSLLNRTGALGLEVVVSLTKQISEGLKEAHRIGVIHRDLKPQNIMIDSDGNARIMDFGIARSIKSIGVTEVGNIVGTPSYMSPEQLGGIKLDERTDIYSLGIILFEMATGKAPFEGEDPFSIAFKQKMEKPPNPKELNPHIPDKLCQLILRCIKKDRDSRVQSAGQLLEELRKINVDASIKGKVEYRSGFLSQITAKKYLLPISLFILLLCVLIFFKLIPSKKGGLWVEKQAIPKINNLIQEKKYISAFQLAREVESVIPGDVRLTNIWSELSREVSIDSMPQGGNLYIKDPNLVGGEWIYLGQTPLQKIKIPLGVLTWKIEKDEGVRLEENAAFGSDLIRFDLTLPDDVSVSSQLFEIQEILDNGKLMRINVGTQHKVAEGQTGRIMSRYEIGAERDTKFIGQFFVSKTNEVDSIIEVINPEIKISKGCHVEFDDISQAVLAVESSPNQADVYVNNEFKGKTDLKLILPPEKYQIKISKDNFLESAQEVILSSGVITPIETSLSRVPPQYGMISIATTPPDAKVFIGNDNALSGYTPFRKNLLPGSYTVRISLDYYKDGNRKVEIKAGETKQESFILEPTPILLSLDSDPREAEVYINDRSVSEGTTPLPLELQPGLYRLRLAKTGFEEYKESILIEPGPSISKNCKLNKVPDSRFALYITTFPEDAVVYINNKKQIPDKPLKLELTTSDVQVKVESEGFETKKESFTLKEDEPTVKNYQLKKLGIGSLTIESFKRAWITVDGKKLAKPVPPRIDSFEVTEGPHIIRFMFDENLYIEKQEIIELNQKKTIHISEDEYEKLLAQKCMYQLSAFPGMDFQLDNNALEKLSTERRIKWLNEGSYILKFFLDNRIDIFLKDLLDKGDKKRIHVKHESFTPEATLPMDLLKKNSYDEFIVIKSDLSIKAKVDENPEQFIQSTVHFPVEVEPGAHHRVLLTPEQGGNDCCIEVFYLNTKLGKFMKIDLDFSWL